MSEGGFAPEELAGYYRRQEAFAPLGPAGQARLARSAVLVAGLGGLGGLAADLLARAGVGRLRLVDRDEVQVDNLHRQLLFSAADAKARRPKVEAAAARLRAANPAVRVEAIRGELTAANAGRFLEGMDLALDALDNLPSRLALNDACLAAGTPSVYAGVAGAGGLVLALVPGATPCLRCLVGETPDPAAFPGGDQSGLINAAPAAAAAVQAGLALRLLAGGAEAAGRLLVFDLWAGRWRAAGVARRPDCSACGA